MNLNRTLGLGSATPLYPDKQLLQYINLKLASLGCPTVAGDTDTEFEQMAGALLLHHRETDRLLADYLCPADQRIQDFLRDYLKQVPVPIRLPGQTFVLDRHGLARALSLPPDRDFFVSDIVSSYRVKQGVLHNPKSDRRTTQGIFHIAEGRPAGARRQAERPQGSFRPNAAVGPIASARLAAPAVHFGPGRTGGVFCFAAVATDRLPGSPRLQLGEEHGDSLLRSGEPGQQSRL